MNFDNHRRNINKYFFTWMNYICYSSIVQCIYIYIRMDYITIIKFTSFEAKWLHDNRVNMNFVEKSIERRSPSLHTYWNLSFLFQVWRMWFRGCYQYACLASRRSRFNLEAMRFHAMLKQAVKEVCLRAFAR